MVAKNDFLIEQFINDKNFKINKDGSILTKIGLNGKPTDQFRSARFFASRGVGFYLKINYRKKQLFVHRIIFRKFNDSLNSNLEINHKDGNKQNNSFENLEQASRSENLKHSYRVLGRVSTLKDFHLAKDRVKHG